VARLTSVGRQKNQLVLAFGGEARSEALSPAPEGTEARVAKCSAESRAREEQWMERICQRENLWQALKRVKANGGSPGIDSMSVDDLPGYLKQHWPAIDGWTSRSRTEGCESLASQRCWTDSSSRR
jgi:RNA-directed DNA polymerase